MEKLTIEIKLRELGLRYNHKYMKREAIYTFEPNTTQEKIDNIECCIKEMENLVDTIKYFYKERFEKFMDKPNYNFFDKKLNNGSFYNIEKLYDLGARFGLAELIFKIRCNDIIKLCKEIENERTNIQR